MPPIMYDVDEERDGLLQSGEARDGDSNKRRRSASAYITPRQRSTLLLFALTACAAFAAGWYFSPSDGNISNGRADASVSGVGSIHDNDVHDMDDSAGTGVDESDRPVPEPLFNSSFVSYLVSGMKERVAANKGTRVHYKYQSHFLERWPDSDLPYWTKKTIPFNKYVPDEKQICFVHVGKAGGSTLGCMLGFSLHCDNDNDIKGLLPIVTTHAFHRGVSDCADNAAYNLFVVRDPLARIQSAFNYERPNMTEDDPFSSKFRSKELYQECSFWTLEQLAQNGLMNRKKDDLSSKCRARAYNAVSGIGKYLIHGYFNYQYYSQFAFRSEDNRSPVIRKGANLLVIRNDHMVDDYNRINEIIGGRQQQVLQESDIPRNNAHVKNATEMYLSDDSKSALCWALCNEIQVYKEILRSAINLNGTDVQSSLDDLTEVCPKEAAAKTCQEKRPDMQHKVESRRGELH